MRSGLFYAWERANTKMQGIDISNLQGHPDTWPRQPWYPQYQAADFVIVQCLEPPPGYPGHDFIDPETGKRGYTGVALRQAKSDSKKVGVYPWLWNGLADTRGNILARLATVPPSVPLDMRPFVDVEDTTGGSTVLGLVSTPNEQRLQRQLQMEPRPLEHSLLGMISLSSRQQDVLEARAAADEWAAPLGLPPSGGYSADWYVNDYLNGWWPDAWLKWWAAYGVPPGSIIAGDIVAHQYGSVPVDLDVMLESEIVTHHGGEECDWGWQAKKPTVVQAGGELLSVADQLTAEAMRPSGPRRAVIRTLADGVRQRANTILA